MPTAVENLTITSSQEDIKTAVSSCIEQTMSEHPGMDQKQAVAVCYSMARKATGKGIGSVEGERQIRG